jgi:hypothetical protein
VVRTACPFCDSGDTELVADWGGQLITSQMRCRSCLTYFEAIREEPWKISYDGGRSAPPPRDHCS